MSAQPLLLIQVGSPPDDVRAREGDVPVWFRRALGPDGDALQVVRVFEGEPLPAPGEHRAAIITGSWAMVTDRLDWSEATADWIRQAMRIDMPLFGVCYGHQLMADALGGQVGYHPDGIELGCQEIECLPGMSSDPLADVVRVAVETVDMAVGFQLDETQRHVLVIHGDEDAAAVGHASQEVLGGCRGGLQASTCRGL